MTKPEIRRATIEDLPQIVALLHDDVLGEKRERSGVGPLPTGYYQAFQSIAADANHDVVVCADEGIVVGCMQLRFLPGLSHAGTWRAQIESLRVARSARRQGMGESMIAFAVKEAKARKCGIIQLTTDKRRLAARSFYEALGFRATHEGLKLELGF
jgi:ribosomal protein S18 acetylase RimI-like enzyme